MLKKVLNYIFKGTQKFMINQLITSTIPILPKWFVRFFSNPYVAASRGYIDEVIFPRSTRLKVANAFRVLRKKKLNNPWKKHDNIPL